MELQKPGESSSNCVKYSKRDSLQVLEDHKSSKIRDDELHLIRTNQQRIGIQQNKEYTPLSTNPHECRVQTSDRVFEFGFESQSGLRRTRYQDFLKEGFSKSTEENSTSNCPPASIQITIEHEMNTIRHFFIAFIVIT